MCAFYPIKETESQFLDDIKKSLRQYLRLKVKNLNDFFSTYQVKVTNIHSLYEPGIMAGN